MAISFPRTYFTDLSPIYRLLVIAMALWSSRVYFTLRNSVRILQNVKGFLFETPEQPEAFPLALPLEPFRTEIEESNGMFDGFLWAVPKRRVSLERRLTRRVAHTQKWSPKNNFLVCYVCGHYHLAHTVCANCYDRVRKETEEMRDVIQEKLKLDPVEKEVVVIYQNDKKPQISQNELLVEIPKERPQWFSQNLLSKGNEPTSRRGSAITSSEDNLK